jgi:type I restriction enzyme S subunit
MREALVKTEEFKDSPVGRIPKDWDVKTLRELSVGGISNGFFKKPELVGSGYRLVNVFDLYQDFGIDLSLVERVNATEQEQRKYFIQPGDCFFTRSSLVLSGIAQCNIIRDVPEPALFECHLMRVRPDKSQVIPEFLALWCRSPWARKFFMSRAKQVTMTTISQPDIAPLPVPLPSKSEQESIVEIHDAVSDAIAHTSSLIAKLKQMKAGLLHDLLTRGLDENGELRDAIGHPEQFKDSPLGQIPQDWDVPHLTKEIDLVHGYAFKGEYFADSPPGDVLLVPGNFHREGGLYFDENNTKYYRGEIPEITVLDNGELLIVMTDLSPRTLILGRVVQLQLPFQVLHNQRIGKIVPKLPDTWDKRFLMLVMNSDRVRRNIISNATGTTVRHTSPDRIMANIILKPNIKEQSRIVEIIEAYDTRIRAEEAYGDKLKLQKKGLMHDLLTGKVRVKDVDKFTPASDTV